MQSSESNGSVDRPNQELARSQFHLADRRQVTGADHSVQSSNQPNSHSSSQSSSQLNSQIANHHGQPIIDHNSHSYGAYACPPASAASEQLRHRSLAYNCMTTTNTFSNGNPISSSFVNHNQASYNNKFQAYQSLVNQSIQPNVKSTSIHPLQSPYYLTNNRPNHLSSSSLPPPGTNHSTLAKGPQPPVSMAGAGKGPQTLLLTTKDGQQTMVVQQPTSVAEGCNVTSLNSVINSSAGQVITINKPLTNSTMAPHQQILVSNTHGGVLPGNMVLNMNPSRPVTPTYVNAPMNNQSGPRGMAPRFVIGSSPIRIGQPVITQRPAGPNILAPNIMQSNIRGTILFKTENGIYLNVGNLPNTSTPNVLPQGYRFAVPVSTSTTGTMQSNANAIRPTLNQQIVTLPIGSNLPRTAVITQQQPTSQPQARLVAPQQLSQPLTIQTTQANNQQANAAPSAMSPNTAKKKCKNFLSTLIRLASDQPEQVATNVRNLIQGLIDSKIAPEDFTVQLQRELNSSPQPCLVPFLKKSLPHLRYSLMMKELTIDGVRPPAPGSCQMPVQQLQFQRSTAQIKILTTNQNAPFQKTPAKSAIPKVTKQTTVTASASTPAGSAINKSALSAAKKKEVASKSKTPGGQKERKEKKSKEDKESFLSSLRDDDDINDVAAMGGVNLVEEHQRILANEEFVGAQIRSCKDDPFLSANSLAERLKKISLSHGLEEVSMDVVALVSHAAEERLKTFVEKLGIIAEHRIENLKMDNRYEITQDVRSQIKFLDELDKLEKKRHLEQEREILMKAAKSRSKAEDPEQLKLKQKAKEMQRAELEEARQREANETALLAIGPRKKLKISHNPTNAGGNLSFNSSSNSVPLSLLSFSNSGNKQRRVKRVNLRDLQFLLEQEKSTVRSSLLYRMYAK